MIQAMTFINVSRFHPHKIPPTLRHDIDRKPGSAPGTVSVEQEFGIRATYYFRMNSNVFRPEIMQEIESMGHEVGYHYEVPGKVKLT